VLRAIAVLLAGFAAVAMATEHPHDAKSLALRAQPKGTSLAWVVKRPSVMAPIDDPATTGGTLVLASDGGESVMLDLPGSGWTTNSAGTVARFRNREAPGGISLVKGAVVKTGKTLKVVARTSGLTLDEAAQGAVSIRLVLGDDVYCSRCTAPIRDEPGRYVAKLCAAPAACVPSSSSSTSVTSTSTSTTTSLLVPGICGNQVIDQPSEECDGTDLGACDDVMPPFAVTCDLPSSPTPCACCGVDACVLFVGGATRCCGGASCQDTTGAGMVRGGACIPPTCAADGDCHGYDCDGGTCCARAGELCGVVGCCPGSDATCATVLGTAPRCCRPPGGTCSLPEHCCSASCAAGLCQ
jgi:hypothetical protein